MPGTMWRPEEDAKLEQFRGGVMTPEAVERVFGGERSYYAADARARALGIPFRKLNGPDSKGLRVPRPTMTRVVVESPDVRVLAPLETADEEDEELWDRAVRNTQRSVGRKVNEGQARIQIVSTQPVAISISSDWHLTVSGACDLPALRDYAEAIALEPGAYAVAVGDLLDNPIKWTKNMDDVPEDIRLLDFMFGRFGSKLLATTDGNHDAWSRQFAGVDNIRRLAHLHRVHYAPDELVYQVEIIPAPGAQPTARYVIATRHQYRRNSALNWTHACWRWAEDNLYGWPKTDDGGTLLPDIIAIGHNHCAEVAKRAHEGGNQWAARMGPFQIATSHQRMGGWPRGKPTAPTFILYPNRERPIDGFDDWSRALEILRREREAYRQAA